MLERSTRFGNACSIVDGTEENVGNTASNILVELGSERFSNTLSIAFSARSAKSVPEHKLLACTSAFGEGELLLDIAFTRAPTNEAAIKLLCDSVRFFVRSRFGGHSYEYSLGSMKELIQPSAIDTPFAIEERLTRRYHIPPGWLKHSLTNDLYYVVDGRLAWSYWPSVDFLMREDAQEFDPKIRPLIDAAREAVWKEHHGPLSSWEYYHEVKQRLKRDNGIDWLTPTELNKGVVIDFNPRRK
jgi:hypothetical protein